ncbi:MAG: glycoside hydrolase family 16 protein [Planctomycetia bacterium]|nr:glycoside hydrolase family 16 protein [Planctomycetia bacterium]
MKKCFLSIFLIFATASIFAQQSTIPELEGQYQDQLPAPPEGMEWKLVWNDEFDGVEIDYQNKWEAPNHPRRDGFWSPKSFALDGQGNLKMMIFQDEEGQFVDGCLRTRGKYEKAKGFFVTRMKMHQEVGHWSAFWLYSASEGNLGEGSQNGAEIDIMEKPWLDERVNFAIHWDGYGKEHQSVGHVAKIDKVMDGFHTFGLWWADDAYRFYIDGNLEWETTADGICNVPLYLKLSDEIGSWAGDIKTASLPDETLIDYVRVYDLFPVQK